MLNELPGKLLTLKGNVTVRSVHVTEEAPFSFKVAPGRGSPPKVSAPSPQEH
jgi:hypothetical protein